MYDTTEIVVWYYGDYTQDGYDGRQKSKISCLVAGIEVFKSYKMKDDGVLK